MKDWIDNASYEELLRKWRFMPAGDPFFMGGVGGYYVKRMEEKYKEIGIEEHIRISKKLDGKVKNV
jgi:hypothetical protein